MTDGTIRHDLSQDLENRRMAEFMDSVADYYTP